MLISSSARLRKRQPSSCLRLVNDFANAFFHLRAMSSPCMLCAALRRARYCGSRQLDLPRGRSWLYTLEHRIEVGHRFEHVAPEDVLISSCRSITSTHAPVCAAILH